MVLPAAEERGRANRGFANFKNKRNIIASLVFFSLRLLSTNKQWKYLPAKSHENILAVHRIGTSIYYPSEPAKLWFGMR